MGDMNTGTVVVKRRARKSGKTETLEGLNAMEEGGEASAFP
jgi:hypothetical protein